MITTPLEMLAAYGIAFAVGVFLTLVACYSVQEIIDDIQRTA
jgi:hypothetical protein